jgi:hypothetical protein
VIQTYTFPSGDATAAPGATAWDIVGVKTTLTGQFGNANGNSYDTLRIDVSFAQNVSNALPAPGQPLSTGTQLGIDIALDTDGNPNTGYTGGCDTANPLKPFEYTTDPGNDPSRLADGNYTILLNGNPIATGGENPPAEAMTSVAGNVMSETFFLTALGVHSGSAPPKIGVGVASFNGALINMGTTPATDCVPIAPTIEDFTV